jgi:hypothetical protein
MLELLHNETSIPIARHGKDIPAQAYALNYRTSIVKQRSCKHASLTIEAVFFEWFVQSGYRQVFGSIEQDGIVESRVKS